jgi:hypothetical protein
MTGFDTPIMLDGPKRRRKSRWFVGMTCLVSAAFIFTTTQLAPTHPLSFSQLQGFVARSSLFDRTPDASSAEHAPARLNIRARTPDVQFDNYSLILKGQRVFLQYVLHRIFSCTRFADLNMYSSGEFHTFRLPVPDLWPDILEKVKAAGMNAVSVYTHMGLINPAPGVVDFNGFRALQPLYDAAKAAGIWIVLRPGE